MSANQPPATGSSQPPAVQPPVTQPPYVSPREQRRAARQERRAARYGASGGAWVGGVILIVLGILFLLQNLGTTLVPDGNWWALFILLPAVAAFGAAWNRYTRDGGVVSGPVISSLITGLILTGLAGALFFNLDLTVTWPVVLILIGLGSLIAAFLKPAAS